MRIDVLTLFPQIVLAPLSDSIVLRARTTGALALGAHDLRQWTDDVHRTVDAPPFGGGAGMVMKIDPIARGFDALSRAYGKPARTLLMTAAGRTFDQAHARELSAMEHVVIVCGHYEGIDARVTGLLSADEVSIGDYVLTGGELAAAVIIDAVARLLPGVISQESIREESHSSGLLEYPQFTRPAVYRGLPVPDVLLSGNHAAINRWRHEESVRLTNQRKIENQRPSTEIETT